MAEQVEQIDFLWDGKDKGGNRTKGEIAAKSETIARTELRKMGIRIIGIKKKPKPLLGARMQKITPGDIAIFSRQLATMLEAGVPLVQSFDIIGKGHENASMQKILLEIKADIESGDTLAEAYKKSRFILMNCFVTWLKPENMPAYWKRCWIKLRLIKKKPSH